MIVSTEIIAFQYNLVFIFYNPATYNHYLFIICGVTSGGGLIFSGRILLAFLLRLLIFWSFLSFFLSLIVKRLFCWFERILLVFLLSYRARECVLGMFPVRVWVIFFAFNFFLRT